MNILAIGSHPDDIEFGCGGTLLKYSENGHKVYMLVLSKGDKGGDPEVRQKEQVKHSSPNADATSLLHCWLISSLLPCR